MVINEEEATVRVYKPIRDAHALFTHELCNSEQSIMSLIHSFKYFNYLIANILREAS